MEVTVDSSVLMAALVKGNEHFSTARQVLRKHFEGEYTNVTSLTVPVEVACSIARRVGEGKAKIAQQQLERWKELGLMRFEELTLRRAEESLRLGAKLKLKGMDAVVVQLAQEGKRPLITFDSEMANRASREIRVLTRRDFQSEQITDRSS